MEIYEREQKIPAANWNNYTSPEAIKRVTILLTQAICGPAGASAAACGRVTATCTPPPEEGSEAYKAQLETNHYAYGTIKIKVRIVGPCDVAENEDTA